MRPVSLVPGTIVPGLGRNVCQADSGRSPLLLVHHWCDGD